MAIDKIIPRFLVDDKDERLLEDGAMTDALNVSVTVNSSQSEGVIKTLPGTAAVSAIAGNAIGTSDSHKCIGSVADSENGTIYWFVWGDNGDHHIVRYNEVSDNYETIIKGYWLRFEQDGFVKGDVINVSVPTNPDSISVNPASRVETFLYFTDNVNEPRRINVTRALDGDYDNASFQNLDFALNVIKAAPNKPCSFRFTTDYNYGQNKITGNTFQFALQYIYKDGEESAIGPYSKLAVSLTDIHKNLPRNNSFVVPLMYNVCEVEIPITDWIYDLKSVRLLARQGGSTTFHVVDEFDPFQDKVTQTTSETLYNATTKIYRFKNDRLLTAVDPTLVNKLYDNVPLKALGQSVAADRLIYANYEEGRNNHDPLVRGIGFSYHDPDEQIGSNIASVTISDYITENASPIDIDIDFSNLYLSSIVPAGSHNVISFDFGPDGNVVASTGNFIEVEGTNPSGDAVTMVSTDLDLFSVTKKEVSFYFFAPRPFDMSVSADRNALVSLIKASLDDYVLSITYNYGTAGSPSTYDLTEEGTSNTASVYGDVKFDFKFDDDVQISSLGVLTLHPRIVKADFSDAGLTNGYTFGPTFGGWASNAGDNVPSTIADNQANQQWSSLISGFLANPNITSVSETYATSFKAGSNHKFGIVYYDKYNRSGFVNEIGTLYNKWYGERNGTTELMGPSSFNISFETGNPSEVAPGWADRYQIVCTGPTEIENYVQYTTGGAYPARFTVSPPTSAEPDEGGSNPAATDPDTEKCQIYVNIDTLNLYRDEKNSLRDYSFTEGDKLRIVSYTSISGYNGTTTPDQYNDRIEYPLANDGSIMEFDVVGVEILNDSNESIIHFSSTDTQHEGTFLVLEQPAIASGATYDDNGTTKTLKYEGFDWFSISNYTYRGQGVAVAENYSSNKNYWGNDCVVEIYTPKKRNEIDVYYEIGESVKISQNPPDPVVGISSGSVHFRPVACKTPYPVANTAAGTLAFNTDAASAARSSVWRYLTRKLECQTASDYFDSKAWSAGRAHVVYDRAAQRRIRNGITYSDAYVEDSEVLYLSSFNPSLANFTSLNHRFGPINHISNYNDDLVAIQQNKLSLIPINKNIIQYADGNSNVAVSTDIIGNPQYSTGDFGCDYPESALVVDNDVFFVDASRRKVMRFTGGQLKPISDQDMQSFFSETFFASDMDRFVSGYDPDDNVYYITGTSTNNSSKNTTYSYNLDYEKWQSRCSFVPDFYGFVNNTMASFIERNGHIHTHDSTTFLNFYGDAYTANLGVVFKASPSKVKVYNAISYEGDATYGTTGATPALNPGRWRVGSGSITTNLGTNTGNIAESDFKFREGTMYASIPRTTSGVFYYEGNIMMLGSLTYQSDGSLLSNAIYLSDRNLSRLSIPFNENLTVTSSQGTFNNVQVKSINKNKIIFDLTGSSALVGELYGNIQIVFDAAINGDLVRGNWARIRLTTDSNASTQLYCINAHTSDSKYYHSLDQ
jgi:hypothetical protein